MLIHCLPEKEIFNNVLLNCWANMRLINCLFRLTFRRLRRHQSRWSVSVDHSCSLSHIHIRELAYYPLHCWGSRFSFLSLSFFFTVTFLFGDEINPIWWWNWPRDGATNERNSNNLRNGAQPSLSPSRIELSRWDLVVNAIFLSTDFNETQHNVVVN